MKKFAVIVAALTATVTLAGCGSGSQPASPDSHPYVNNQFSNKQLFEEEITRAINNQWTDGHVVTMNCIKTSPNTATCLATDNYEYVHRIKVECQTVDAAGGHDCIVGEE